MPSMGPPGWGRYGRPALVITLTCHMVGPRQAVITKRYSPTGSSYGQQLRAELRATATGSHGQQLRVAAGTLGGTPQHAAVGRSAPSFPVVGCIRAVRTTRHGDRPPPQPWACSAAGNQREQAGQQRCAQAMPFSTRSCRSVSSRLPHSVLHSSCAYCFPSDALLQTKRGLYKLCVNCQRVGKQLNPSDQTTSSAVQVCVIIATSLCESL